MAQKKIATVEYTIPGHDELHVDIYSKTSLHDYDIAIVDPDIYPFFQYSSDTYLGKKSLGDDASFRLKEHLEHWNNEIHEALRAGKTVIVLMNKPVQVYVATGDKEYSGTGRNQKTTRIVDLIHNYKLIPGLKNYREAQGSSMRLVDRESPVGSYWSDFSDYSEYWALIEDTNVKPLITPRTGNTPVGVEIDFAGMEGHLFLLPYVDFSKEEFYHEQDDEWIYTDDALKLGTQFLGAVVRLDTACKNESTKTPIPTWMSGHEAFNLPIEEKITSSLLKIESQIEAAQSRKLALLEELEIETQIKGLLYETGKPLEKSIIEALKLLGFKAAGVQEGDSEFDVVFESSEGRFLGESEGKDRKSISITKLRQLEMNIHEDLERDEVVDPAKGVLFGNAFRLLEPSERGKPFTDKCETAAARTQTALVDTVDLFHVAKYLSGKSNKRFATACRKAILSAVGIVRFPETP